jgi:acyl-CoA reductase-like NAD-dependent aldehyde dehydrogenase
LSRESIKKLVLEGQQHPVNRQLEVRNPRSGELDYQIVPAERKTIIATVDRLRQAQRHWRDASLDYRLTALSAFAEAVQKHRAALLNALTCDTGRYGISVIEVSTIASAVERWGKLARALAKDEETIHQAALPDVVYRYQRIPYGVVGVISPWNFPLTLSLIDALPALVAGNAVVIKPSEITPRFAQPLRRILAEVPALEAVMGLIDGDGSTGAALIDQVDAICFTGSVETGRLVAEQAARNFIPAFLELGGNDPAIVLGDADVERAAMALLRASILNTGQACQSIERIYVASNLYDDFVQILIDQANTVTLNHDNLHSGHLGPLIDSRQGDVIEAQLADAVEKGATIHTGGSVERRGGIWCLPTVVTNVNHAMALMQEETFGPILPVMPFNTDDDAIALANDTIFGLSAAVFSQSLDHAEAVGKRIEAGGISINDASLTAFVHEAEKNSFKCSGLGASRMGASGLLRFYRKQALIANGGPVADIHQFDEAIFFQK